MEGPVRGQQKPYCRPHGVAKLSLSGAGDVSLECEAGGGVQRLGDSVYKLPQGTKILAVPIVEVDQPKAGKREGIHLSPQAFVVFDGERVGVDHLGAVQRVVRLGHRGTFYGVNVTLYRIEPGKSPARRSRLWSLIGWSGGGRWHSVFCRSGWRGGCYTGVRRRSAGLSGSASETRG